MIGRLMSVAGTLIVCFCLGTLIAESVVFAYVWSKWQMNWDKVRQIVAVAQGYDLVAMREEAELEKETVSVEQPSLEQVVEARAAKDRDLELREQALAQAVEQFRFKQRKQAEELTRFDSIKKAFETKLTKAEADEKSSGFQENIVILQNMKPKQAKEQLLQMVDNKEMDAVVRLMAAMSPSKRKKISAEFRTPEENKTLGEILRRIREGFPLAMLTDETQQQLHEANSTNP